MLSELRRKFKSYKTGTEIGLFLFCQIFLQKVPKDTTTSREIYVVDFSIRTSHDLTSRSSLEQSKLWYEQNTGIKR